MAHARQQIREAFATRVTGLALTGSRVFQTRVYPNDPTALPGLSIYTRDDEKQEGHQTLGLREQWQLDVICEARCKPATGAGDVDDVLDTICAQVQAAVMADNTLTSRVLWMELLRTRLSFSGELERAVGMAEMTWRCSYLILAGAPETLIYAP